MDDAELREQERWDRRQKREALAALHARNVDKQRRRLLALKCSHKARTCDASAIAAQEGDSPYADWCRRRAAKLRTIAARLTSPSQ